MFNYEYSNSIGQGLNIFISHYFYESFYTYATEMILKRFSIINIFHFLNYTLNGRAIYKDF